MTTKTKLTPVSLVLLLLGSVLLTTSALFAQAQQDRIELSLSPQVWEVSANAGDSVDNVFRIGNNSEETIEIETIAKNFTPRGEEGAVDLTEDTTSFSLADWITITPARTFIDGKDNQDFSVTINVPENAEPGGHFGSVVFKTIPPAQESGVASVSQEVAPVILVAVAGDIEEAAEVASFRSTKSFWSNERPIEFETRIQNNGNVHFKPSGSITIKNMFGNEVTTINLEEKNVLPDSIRRLITEWEPGFSIGRYSADLTLVYGEDNQILNASTTFIIFPYQTVLPAAILILGLLFVMVKFRKRFGEAFRVLTGR